MAGILLAAAAMLPFDGQPGDGLARFVGRFHVLLLHFPVTLLLLAPLLSLASRFNFLPNAKPFVRLVWWLGSIAAFFTVGMGMLLAANEGYALNEVREHMLGGICVALLAFIATALYEKNSQSKQDKIRQNQVTPNKVWFNTIYGSVSSALVVAIFIAAHAGGNLVHGDTYLTRFAPEPFGTWLRPEQDGSALQASQLAQIDDAHFNQKVRPLLDKYCFGCHGADTQKGGIQLDNLSPDFVNSHDAPNWHAALDMINTGEMPPKKKQQPSDAERRILVDWLTEGILLAKEAKKGESKQVIRRLTKQQYSNTLQDLLGINVDFADLLPDDPLSHMGFSNSGELLQSSTLHLETFEQIARNALDKAIDPEQKPKVHHYRMVFGKDQGIGEPHSLSRGYMDVPVSTNDFYVEVLKQDDAEAASTPDAIKNVKKYFSASMRGSYAQHFKTQQQGIDLYSATPHVEIVKSGKYGTWNTPSPNLSMQIKDHYPLSGDFMMRVKASKANAFSVTLSGVAATQAIPPAITLDKHGQPKLANSVNFAAQVKANFAVEGFSLDKHNPELARPEKGNGVKTIQLPLKLAQSRTPNFYQIDMVHEGATQPSEFEVSLNYKHRFKVKLPAAAKAQQGKLMVSSLGVAYIGGRNHTVVVKGTDKIPAFTDVVLTKVDADSAVAKQMPLKTVNHKIAQNNQPILMPYVGTRTDDGVDYKHFAQGQVVKGEVGDSQVYEFKGRLENLPIPPHGTLGDNITSSSLKLGVWNDDKVKTQQQKGSVINVEYIEFEAPYFESWPTASHQQIFIDSNLEQGSQAYAEQVIHAFANRAFRRSVTKDELAPYLGFYQEIASEFPRFEDGVKEALVAILCSPNFLYLAEPNIESQLADTTTEMPSAVSQFAELFGFSQAQASSSSNSNSQAISEYALASRLSYFIWNSAPDAELLKLASQGELRQQLPQQLARMVGESDKLNRFVSVFAKEWLRLDRQQMMTVDAETFPDYTRFVKQDMAQETVQFIQTLIQQDLTGLNLIESDFAVLNQNLAEFYGIEGVKGNTFRQVQLDDSQPRGGLLAQGAFLTGHGDGVHSHPVKRAVWLKSKILGDEPPPPPPNVPELDPETPGFEKLTLKQQLELHRDKDSCRDCHAKIDPYGIVFENYDAVGRYRAEYKGAPVDSLSVLPDGAEVAGLQEIKAYLLNEQADKVMLSLTKHLFAYALGKDVSFHDDAELAAILAAAKDENYRMQSLLLAIVTSPSFNQS
ncbi:hypothetical protein C2869_09580 [Saccharobesus litoralis]|uniref:Cytochrome c domain-containing protein n=2 Tax=Saccharobesus litoralis TaxID=2172099 RepID=A0A2S0VXT0_9ALTE|nr:hypothetical protein C2869_09580 [Saccharobesus litoralis]